MGRKEVTSMGGNCLLLRPERASLFDAMGILFSSSVGRRRSVVSSRMREDSLEYRFIIFVSLLLQKIVQSLAVPMAWVESMLGLFLNTLSFNGGFGSSIPKFFLGRVLIPDPTSKDYVSIVGNLDTRILLNGSLSPGDGRYGGAVTIMAAKTAYENKSFTQKAVSTFWKMEFVGAYDFWNEYIDDYATHAFVMLDKNTNPETYIVSFRGTRPFNAYEWCMDLDISWYWISGVGRAHAGYMEALGLKPKGWPIQTTVEPPRVAYYFLLKKLKEVLKENTSARFMVTGHSLGGALAIMFASFLAINEEEWLLERLMGVYTFGQPRVGDEQFGKFVMSRFKKYEINYTRYVYCNDVVPKLPAFNTDILYRHFGTCLYFNSLYQGKICKEENKRNYFWPWELVLMFAHTIWELVRSCILGLVLRGDYGEGRLLKLIRILGLVIPGLTDHAPVNYVNAAMLGS